MRVYTIDPMTDARWDEFISVHDGASVFHTRAWLEAIRRTYDYTPVVYTTSSPSQQLLNGIVLCDIRSWLTGRRLVSLPFSDHCEPLFDSMSSASAIAEELKRTVGAGKWKYIELRPTSESLALDGVAKASACLLHRLDLRPSPDELFRRTQKTSIQQRIKRAEREGIEIECGNSERLLNAFYHLLIQTRRRHQVPPQPIQWFRNLVACMGDRLRIRVAMREGEPIASIVTLEHKDVIVYKYGCSDSRFSSLGATPYLIWRAIVDGKANGMKWMDFGRSDLDNPGLIAFKDRWGAKSSELNYLRWSQKQSQDVDRKYSSGVMKRVFAMMPDSVLETTGRILYRHIG